MAVIYRIRNIVNDKCYIGSTVNVSNRRKHHWHELKKGIHPNRNLQEDWNKYGAKSFVFEILETVGRVSTKHLRVLEQKHLNKVFGTNCYNIAPSTEHYGYEQGKANVESGDLEKARKMISPNHLEKARSCIKNLGQGALTKAAKKLCVITSPEGEKYLVINRTGFAKYFNLRPDVLTKILSDNPNYKYFKSCQGWTAYRISQREASNWSGKVWNLDHFETW